MQNSIAVISDITTAVSTQVRGYVSHGTLQLPANYSVDNALKSAMLMLPDIKDKNKVPVTQSCTADSIKGALLSMCVQGLNPDKKQCYFLPYGERLTMQRSYFGDIVVAKQVDPSIEDIYPAAVFKDDEFDYDIDRGKTTKIRHKQKPANKNNPIEYAYATIVYKDGREVSTVMTWEQIKQSWKQSQANPVNADGSIKPDSTHGKYPESMALRTVVRRACKAIIDSSDDSNLVVQFSRQSSDEADAAAVEQEIKENANSEIIDAEFRDVDVATGEVKEDDPF
ncbi:MAG: RecT family recombinase [Lentisphaeria bacterium]